MPIHTRSPHLTGLEPYLTELQSIPPLLPGELENLSREISEGSLDARERIVLTHLEWVVKIACHYAGYGLPLADLIAEGNLGLLRAAELYHCRYGVPFQTYARVWVKQRIHRAITAQAHTIRIPVWRSQRLRKLDRLHADLEEELGRDVTLSDLAARIGIPEEELQRISQERLTFTPIEEQDLFEAETPSPEAPLLSEELQAEIAACLEGLEDHELKILSLRFGLLDSEPESYRSMAPRFGKSREWIRKTGELALQKLKTALSDASELPRDLIALRQRNLKARLNKIRKTLSKREKKSENPLSLSPLVLT